MNLESSWAVQVLFLALEQKLKQETKISIKFTSKGFRKFGLKIATHRAYILRGKGFEPLNSCENRS